MCSNLFRRYYDLQSTWQDHLAHLKAVLTLLTHRNVDLGHVISAQCVELDPSKVQAVLDWPIPQNVKAVRGFLGLTGYHRQFIQNYGKFAKPLTTLTKKEEGFSWGNEQAQAFEEFIIESDASGQGKGAVLMQERRPIAYYSEALSSSTLSKSVYEKEIVALALSVQHWRHYLLGRSFKVYTDHRSLEH